MKNFHPSLLVAITLSILVAACGGAPEAPQTERTEPTGIPATQVQPVEPPAETPSLQPINLAGPPAGTPMVWVDGSILVHVPGGDFIMGDGGDDDPIHTVGLSSFWIYRTKVTNRMYSICMATGDCAPPQDQEAVKALADPAKRDFPVVNVDWEQAETYCKFVEGHLPTEAQWEKTARGPDGNVYPWGDAAPTCDLSNFKDCVGEKSNVFDYPAGKSYYDALDLAGNIYEWVADWYTPQYYGESPGVDPLGPERGTVRSVRSSGFDSEENTLSSARRFYLKPDENRLDLGFRCVVENPAQYEPFCGQVSIPGYPQNGQTNQATPSSNCPTPVFTTFVGTCVDQTAQLGNGSVKIEGGQVTSVVGPDCSEDSPGVWFCTGPQGTSASLTACLACQSDQSSSNVGAQCPPGTYDNGAGQCIGRGDTGLCPKGYSYDAATRCCSAQPDIPYPGCDPASEYLTALNTCQPGTAPLTGSCGVASVPLGACKQPGGGGSPGGDPCNGLDIRSCYNQQNTCYWDYNQNLCVSK
jgi:formylglycine-generating enzyme required for sulfatase activity